jgi:hypothetical protein
VKESSPRCHDVGGGDDNEIETAPLSVSQRRHFAVHGWLVLPGIVPSDLCERLSREMDAVLSGLACWDADSGLQGFGEPHLRAPLFLELFKAPGLLPACNQLSSGIVASE